MCPSVENTQNEEHIELHFDYANPVLEKKKRKLKLNHLYENSLNIKTSTRLLPNTSLPLTYQNNKVNILIKPLKSTVPILRVHDILRK